MGIGSHSYNPNSYYEENYKLLIHLHVFCMIFLTFRRPPESGPNSAMYQSLRTSKRKVNQQTLQITPLISNHNFSGLLVEL